MATRMEGDNIRYFCLSCRQHSQWRHKCMTSLAVNEIPCAVFDQRIKLWRDIIVAPRRPGLHTNDTHSLVLYFPGEPVIKLLWFGCQQCDIDSITYQASSDFMHMRLDSAHMRKIARRHH